MAHVLPNQEILTRWDCKWCTYSNHAYSTECGMCSKPRPNQAASNNSNFIECIHCHADISFNQYQAHLTYHEQQQQQPPPPSNDDETIPCEFCTELIRITDYNHHLDQHNEPNATIPCDTCGQQIPVTQYNDHIASHNIHNKPELIPCEYDSCKEKISPQEYESHIAAHKMQEKDEKRKQAMKDEVDYIPCDICKYKIPSTEYTKHRKSHETVLIPCDYPSCSEKVPFDEYQAHKEMHKKEEEKKMEEMCVICDHKGCGKSIPIKQLAIHQESHRMEETNVNLHEQLAKLQQEIQDLNSQKANEQKENEEKMNKAAQEAQQLKQKIAEQEASFNKLQQDAQNNQVIYPKWWDIQQLKTLKYGEYKLIELDMNTNDVAKEVVASFKKTAGNQIVKILGIMNQMLYDKWWNEKQTMIKLIGTDKLNQRNLFHGTKAENVMNFILKEGFRKEFNTAYASGQGTYLARDANYSVGYSSNVNGLRKMFRCQVVCGESHAGSGSYTLTTWPKKSNGLIYDSLIAGTIDNPSVVVIHENSRIYPMFVIHFK